MCALVQEKKCVHVGGQACVCMPICNHECKNKFNSLLRGQASR